ncbi:pilus assembly protein TadG-related protein [Agromyces sp. SYSU T0242]|uniref:pilus assembly protein TadG-related protein n=1 Tax=Agromyces litoreus TaxID=3158561 RepID=UPI0033953436
MRPRDGRLVDDESGSTLLLTIAYGTLALVLVLVVVSATSLYLERKRLYTLADGTALAAAEAWRLEDVRLDGDALVLGLDDESVRSAAVDYLAAASTRGGVELLQAASADGRSATITLRTIWHAPISTEFIPVSVPIEVTADARSVFH